jgi:hypothetical protein
MDTQAYWFQVTTLILYWGSVVAFLVGLCVIVSPGLVIRAGRVVNRWVSTDEAFASLDAPRHTERYFYRHHRLFGGLLVLAAIYVLYSFTFEFDPALLARRVVLFGSLGASESIYLALVRINLLFGAVALLLGAIIFVRPSLLKGLETWANRWFAPDRTLRTLDVQLRAPDRFLARYPRVLGILIMAGSLYVIINLRIFL